jgi:hypothetical protein
VYIHVFDTRPRTSRQSAIAACYTPPLPASCAFCNRGWRCSYSRGCGYSRGALLPPSFLARGTVVALIRAQQGALRLYQGRHQDPRTCGSGDHEGPYMSSRLSLSLSSSSPSRPSTSDGRSAPWPSPIIVEPGGASNLRARFGRPRMISGAQEIFRIASIQ